ncbi:MAG: hypothetical protein P8124_01530 [Gammaproteobacteria bacterium]
MASPRFSPAAAVVVVLGAVALATVSLGAGLRTGRSSPGLHSYVSGAAVRIGPLTPLTRVFRPGQRLRAVRLGCGAPLVCPVALYAGAERVGYLPGKAARAVDRVLAGRGRVSVRVVQVDSDDPVRGARVHVSWRG